MCRWNQELKSHSTLQDLSSMQQIQRIPAFPSTTATTKKLVLKKLHKSTRVKVLGELTLEVRGLAKSSKPTGGLRVGARGISKKALSDAGSVEKTLQHDENEQLAAIKELQDEPVDTTTEYDEMTEADGIVTDEQGHASEQEQEQAQSGPAEWHSMPEDEVVQFTPQLPELDDSTPPTGEERRTFLLSWIDKQERGREEVEAHAFEHALEEPSSFTIKSIIKGRWSYHSSRRQHCMPVTLCQDRSFATIQRWNPHLAKTHPEEIWHDETSADQDDDGDMDEENNEAPVNKGKGKAQ
ncbi:hypothetical protein J1614_007022 [Plenodomus biglobosus]|nr:hypothetical protein J1614_007022 [Plenodomus biglobosus]